MTQDITVYDQQEMLTMGNDDIVQIAAQAEARVNAVIKIKRAALMVTNGADWVDQNGKPYLMASGAEKIANLFNISWRFMAPEPIKTPEQDGQNFIYTYVAEFTMGSRHIQVEGSRSSKDKFFTQYTYEGKEKSEKAVMDRDNERDVKAAAMTNLLGNGITRLLGIRNLSYEDLKEFAGITKDMIGKVEYKGKNDKPKITPPQSKKQPPPVENKGNLSIVGILEDVKIAHSKPDDPKQWERYGLIVGGKSYGTFDSNIRDTAQDNVGNEVSIVYKEDGRFLTCVSFSADVHYQCPDKNAQVPSAFCYEEGCTEEKRASCPGRETPLVPF